jgi:hypothetical protein
MSHDIEKVSVVAVYNQIEGVKQSLTQLKKYGFDIKNVSIAGKKYRPCSSLFIIPDLGPIAVGGPLVGALVKGLGGASYFRGLNALREGLRGIGIPRDSLFRYETALKKGMCLVFVQDGVDKIAEVKSVFASSKAIKIAVHYSQSN